MNPGILTRLANASQTYPTAECFIVTPGVWTQIEREAGDMRGFLVKEERPPGLQRMEIMGVPVVKTRGACANVEFAEVHHRPDGYQPQIMMIR